MRYILLNRLGVVFLLLVLLARGAPGFAKQEASRQSSFNNRVLKVLLVADEVFRQKPGWEEELREDLQYASQVYIKEYGISFEVTGTPYALNIQEKLRDYPPISRASREEYESWLRFIVSEISSTNSDAEIAIAFIGYEPPNLERLKPWFAHGISPPFGRAAVIRYIKAYDHPKLHQALICHEVAHIFGAFHSRDQSSLMRLSFIPENQTGILKAFERIKFQFDDVAKEMIEANRNHDFSKSLDDISSERIKAMNRAFKKRDFANQVHPLSGAYVNLASVAAFSGSYTEMENFCQKALAIDPNNGYAYSVLGKSLMKRQEHKEGIAALRKAVSLRPDDWGVQLDLASAFIHIEEWTQAQAPLLEMVKLRSTALVGPFLLAICFWNAGNRSEGRKLMRQVVNYNPTYRNASVLLRYMNNPRSKEKIPFK